ncbi:hypothetical protein PVL30_002738 [Lodderomyces elongisporus]|uniref:uncharacterized protein n=1 Tax=Lodderomyces elongisporus TaxID=36914 RepID=UPI002920AAD9|nr:uncharacterized protein PVL30_002738 [Lodderomyces elongisporus]WLF78989.1 hypothetical protein PVL30_002738 [Lodderomyces elongisporus]
MTEVVNAPAAELLNAAIDKSLPARSFVLLFIQTTAINPLNEDSFAQLMLPLSHQIDDLEIYRLSLLVSLSFSTIFNCELFWSALGKLPSEFQAKYILEIHDTLQKKELPINQEVIKQLVLDSFPQYIQKSTLSISENNGPFVDGENIGQIVTLAGTLVDQFSNVINHNWDETIVNFAQAIQHHTGVLRLLQNVREVLAPGTVQRLEDMSSEVDEDDLMQDVASVVTSPEKASPVKWIYDCTKDFALLQQLERPQTFVRKFKEDCILSRKHGDNEFIAQTLVQALIEVNVNGNEVHLFNLKNFVLTRLPQIIIELNAQSSGLMNQIATSSFADEAFKSALQRAISGAKDDTDNTLFRIKTELKSKLVDVNPEFTTFEESGLLEFLQNIPKLLLVQEQQKAFSFLVLETFEELARASEVEKVSRLLMGLINSNDLINIILFNTNKQIIDRVVQYIDNQEFDTEEINDNINYLGISLMFAVLCTSILDPRYTPSVTYSSSSLSPSDATTTASLSSSSPLSSSPPSSYFENYLTIKPSLSTEIPQAEEIIFELFSAEGVSDDLLNKLSIKEIYKVIPNIYMQAIEAYRIGIINLPILLNGLEYFPLAAIALVPYLLTLDTQLREVITNQLLKDNNIVTQSLAVLLKRKGCLDS